MRVFQRGPSVAMAQYRRHCASTAPASRLMPASKRTPASRLMPASGGPATAALAKAAERRPGEATLRGLTPQRAGVWHSAQVRQLLLLAKIGAA